MNLRVRASIVCVHDGKLLVFKGVDPFSKQVYWFLPGGKIEADETPFACAERETLEETGYRVKADLKSEIIKSYRHPWNGSVYDCKTYFYRAHLVGLWHAPTRTDDVDYNLGPAWLPLSQIDGAFGYTPEIHEAVTALSFA